MRPQPYFMRDLNGDKINSIMDFNVVSKRRQSRSMFEIGVFFGAVLVYVIALAFSA